VAVFIRTQWIAAVLIVVVSACPSSAEVSTAAMSAVAQGDQHFTPMWTRYLADGRQSSSEVRSSSIEPVTLWLSDRRLATMSVSDREAEQPFFVPSENVFRPASFQPDVVPESEIRTPAPSTPPGRARLPTADIRAALGRMVTARSQEFGINPRIQDPTFISRSATLGARGGPFTESLDVVVNGETAPRVTTDAGNVLFKSPSLRGSHGHRRTPIITAPSVRGSRYPRLPASGSFWFPAREDLDTMLSKIDSRIIENLTVIRGPYTVLHGPGYDFVDVELLSAPRFDDGFQSFGQSSVTYKTNGEQWYGRQSVWGGSTDWGYRVGYGHRTGSDYASGDGQTLPSSYNSRMPDVALGADLTSTSQIDFHYLRLDQTDVEFPTLIFDFDFLVTDAYEFKYTQVDLPHCDLLTLEGWYNRTRFAGSAGAFKQDQFDTFFTATTGHPPPIQLGVTDVDSMSTGFRLAITEGETDASHLTAGVDLRFLKQRLNEFNKILLGGQIRNFPIPRSHSSNPGIFLEGRIPWTERSTVRSGVRVDWVSTNAAQTAPEAIFADLSTFLGGEFDQHFRLWSAFASAEYEIDPALTAVASAGHAQCPPSMTELYAVIPFVAVLPQNVYTSVIGNPNLDAERRFQLDLSIRYDAPCVRAGIGGFYAWIQDYITLSYLDPPDGIAYRFQNTDLATLSGGEGYGEVDLLNWMTTFAAFSFVEGRDHTLSGRSGNVLSTSAEEPLPVIPPLETRLGLRAVDGRETSRWAVELSARIVDNQDRVATSLKELTTPGFTTLDFRGYWQVTDQLLLIGGVENFTDKNYREHFDPRPQLGLNTLQPGISFYFSSELTY